MALSQCTDEPCQGTDLSMQPLPRIAKRSSNSNTTLCVESARWFGRPCVVLMIVWLMGCHVD